MDSSDSETEQQKMFSRQSEQVDITDDEKVKYRPGKTKPDKCLGKHNDQGNQATRPWRRYRWC